MLDIGYSPENSKIHDPDFDSDSDDDPFSPRPSLLPELEHWTLMLNIGYSLENCPLFPTPP